MNAGSEESEEGVELLELDSGKRLGENITNHIFGWAVFDNDVASGNGLTNEMKVNINVFGASMESSIF